MINIYKHSLHWKEGFHYEFRKKRECFAKILKYAKKRQIVAITGLRRVGKTVLLKQTINHLIESEKVGRKNILYFSFDEERPKIDELLQEYAAITGVDAGKESVFVFLDEVQKLEGWQEQIKVYYDNYSNLKFFVSGSASLFVRKRSQESLAGRIFTIEIPILTFKEFLFFSDKDELLRNPKMFREEIKKELPAYFRRNFIEIIKEDEETAKFYMESIINKIVYEDIPLLFPVENPEKLKSIVRAIYSNPGMVINYERFAGDMGLSPKTLEKYLYYLLQAKIIKKAYNFSRNFLTSEKKMKKFYISAPCFCFLNENFSIPKIAENMVAVNDKIIFFWRDPFKNEVDFVMERNGKPLAVEIKYKNRISKQDVKGLLKFLDRFRLREGLAITADYEGSEKFNGKTIKFTSLWKWLLHDAG